MKKKKLVLEIIDPVGNVVTTHELLYERGRNNKLRLTIDGTAFMWEDPDPIPDWKDEVLDPRNSVGDVGRVEKLFDEENLVPVWVVRYADPTRGNKGESVYMHVSAPTEAQAKTDALAFKEFNQHILPEHYDSKYLSASRATGNYVIGRVEYFEGDERL